MRTSLIPITITKTVTIENIFKNIDTWPVNRMYREREVFIDHANRYVFDEIVSGEEDLYAVLEKAIYLEQNRVKNNPWSVDPNDEKDYWKELSSILVLSKDEDDPVAAQKILLQRIINRYNEEIVGDFKEKTFRFARKFLTFFFKLFFNTFGSRILKGLWGNKAMLKDRINVLGYVDEVKALFPKTTVVIVPTHQSNIDSILVGYTIDSKLELPAFTYGAGLNLYNSEIPAYFMNRLGTYKVDRRKRNSIYLKCLTGVVSNMTKDGVNNLFFPGGTRSRDGKIESKLKLGLLGAVLETQRDVYLEGRKDKIVIVPVVMSYHYVLEAKSLIDQYLRRSSNEKYKKPVKSGNSTKYFFSFARDLFSRSSNYYFAVGKPMDVFGNHVDMEGNSIDNLGQPIDIKGYFSTEGDLSAVEQREKIYTKHLGESIAASYQDHYIALTSHLVAFTMFELMRKGQDEKSELWDLITMDISGVKIDSDEFRGLLGEYIDVLKALVAEEALYCDDVIMSWDMDRIIKDGLYHLGQYHAAKVLYEKDGYYRTDDIRLLYYYYNRLDSHLKFRKYTNQ